MLKRQSKSTASQDKIKAIEKTTSSLKQNDPACHCEQHYLKVSSL